MKIDNMARVATITPVVSIGNIMENANRIADIIKDNRSILGDADIIVTPELALVGYTCQDLLFRNDIASEFRSNKVFTAMNIIKHSLDLGQIAIIGTPLAVNNKLLNCAVVVNNFGIKGITVKTYLPNYNEFYEKRWFVGADEVKLPETISFDGEEIPIGNRLVYETKGMRFGIEICEDLWSVYPPSLDMSVAGAEVIVNISASNETVGKSSYRRDLVKQQSARCICGYAYCSAGMSESTSDLVFSGHNIIAENGSILSESTKFNTSTTITIADIDLDRIRHDRLQNTTFRITDSLNEVRIIQNMNYTKLIDGRETLRKISITPFVPSYDLEERCKEIFDMQVAGLASRWLHTGSSKLVLGISGGLDSTLALLVAVGAANKINRPHSDILGITMPCFGTTDRTKNNAVELMQALDISYETINIGNSVLQHMKDLGIPDTDRSVAYENCQARERTQVLMDMSNKVGGFVVGTGDLSELALGWCTYNGDHMSMYSVNSSIPKTLVRALVSSSKAYNLVDTSREDLFNDTIQDILNTPVSPELLPPDENGSIAQLTESSIGPYVLNDFFLYYTVRFGMSASKIFALAVTASEQSSEYHYSKAEIKKWLIKFYERFARAQFKRNCCPDGVKVGSVSFSPRGDWRMASEADFTAQIEEINSIKI
jgi:NAD+ synthase (glutamine-hydrolysing)